MDTRKDFRQQALGYVSWVLDDALSADHTVEEIGQRAVLVGWQCGFEPLFVAVIGSTCDTKGRRDKVDPELAVEIATDYLVERKWFAGEPPEPDYVIVD